MPKKTATRLAALAFLAALSSGTASATELVYVPYNPSFGGNPLNGPNLLNSALATNRHTDPNAVDNTSGIEDQSPLAQFKQQLERSILNRLASAATSKMFDAQGNFVPGTFETDNFTINIVDSGGGTFTITTTDKATGSSTVFQVGQ